MDAKKTKRRIQIIDQIMAALCSRETYDVLDSTRVSESTVATFLYPILLKHLTKTYRDVFKQENELAEKHARRSLLWEHNKGTTINNVKFLGTQHRPDFVIQIDNFSIAVEVKIGESGQSIREGIGQSLVYVSSEFDFVCYLFVDSSSDHKIVHSINNEPEKSFLSNLWEKHNVRFNVVN